MGQELLVVILGKTITIVDNDTSIVEISSPTYSVAEDAGSFTFEVVTSGEHEGFSISITFGGDDDTAVSRQDYTPLAINRYSFNLKSTDVRSQEREFTIPLIDNSHVDGDKTVSISLTIDSQDRRKIQLPKGVNILSKTFTIVDDDATTVSVSKFNFLILMKMKHLKMT